jgi:glutamate-ammonia-ligase adenylyltransferase
MANQRPRLTGDLEELIAQLKGGFGERIAAWRQHPRVLALREESRTRLARLVLRTAQWVEEGKVSEEAAMRLADWIEPLLRRESYLALLLERPKVHERLLRLLGLARWPARYLLKHPGVIDELAGDAMLEERFNAGRIRARAGAPAHRAAGQRRRRRRSPAEPAAPGAPR